MKPEAAFGAASGKFLLKSRSFYCKKNMEKATAKKSAKKDAKKE